MADRGEHSYREITTQGESWRGALEAVAQERDALLTLLKGEQGATHIFIGCGSTHYLAQYAAPFFQETTGRRCRGVPSSELLLQTETVVSSGEKVMVIALSRSGETSETVMAAHKLREAGARILTVSCYADTPLAQESDATVQLPQGREQSYAQTRSFAGMLVAVQALAAIVAGNEALLDELRLLPGLAGDLIRRAEPVAKRYGRDERIQRITYLGSGPLYGLANEATVKMKEMSLSMAEPYHFMEFRHGPMSLVDEEHLVVGLLSERTRGYELGVLRDLKRRAARVLVVGHGVADLAQEFDGAFDLRAPLSERAQAVLYLPFVQLFAYHRAVVRGLNPDRPRHVVMSIRLDGEQVAE